MADQRIELLLRQLDQAFDQRSWHGPNLMGALRGLAGEILVWRPQPDRHNIAELALHTAYWKYRAYRLITDEPPRSFGIPGSDFIARNDVPTHAEWKADLDHVIGWHRRLRAAVEALPAVQLRDIAKEKLTVADLIGGVAAHDLYHAGQIQLLKRLHQNDRSHS